MNQYYLVLSLIFGFFIYRLFKFIKRKVRWLMASIPAIIAMTGTNISTSKLNHFFALFA
jgi:hypothetical protein